jgi:hypothetical protein
VIDSQLVAVAVTFAQCSPGHQLLRAHLLVLVLVAYVAVEQRIAARPKELHRQEHRPGVGRERVAMARIAPAITGARVA